MRSYILILTVLMFGYVSLIRRVFKPTVTEAWKIAMKNENCGSLVGNLAGPASLGNMMFQYAGLFAIANRTHRTPIVNGNGELGKIFTISHDDSAKNISDLKLTNKGYARCNCAFYPPYEMGEEDESNGNSHDWNILISTEIADVIAMEKMNSREVDLCLLTKFNHTAMSVGTYGFWGAFLSGDVVYQKEFAYRYSVLWWSTYPDDWFKPNWQGISGGNTDLSWKWMAPVFKIIVVIVFLFLILSSVIFIYWCYRRYWKPEQ